MDRTERVTLTNMCMIQNGDKVVIQDRNDDVWPGVVFPGGHVEKEESIVESVIREVKEETGLLIDNLEFCGLKQFFTESDGRYIVFLYKTATFHGELIGSKEGNVSWITLDALKNKKLAGGFYDMLPLFMGEKQELIYRNGGKEWIS